MSKRVTYKQRKSMLAFMQGHEDFAKGRVSGPGAVHLKQKLMLELADELNALGGPTKSADKWVKCWQDWKSDVKAKFLKIKKSMASNDGGPAPTPLSPLEDSLLQFFGIEMVEGVAGVADPLSANAASDEEPTEPSRISRKKRPSMKTQEEFIEVNIPKKLLTEDNPNVADQDNTFGLYLNKQLQKLASDQRIIAEKLMSDILFLARSNQLNTTSQIITGQSSKYIKEESE